MAETDTAATSNVPPTPVAHLLHAEAEPASADPVLMGLVSMFGKELGKALVTIEKVRGECLVAVETVRWESKVAIETLRKEAVLGLHAVNRRVDAVNSRVDQLELRLSHMEQELDTIMKERAAEKSTNVTK
jgi:hypothetical protein